MSYSDATKAQAIGHPGDDATAARAVGVPRRTVSRWRAEYKVGRHAGAAAIVELTRDAAAHRAWGLISLAMDQMERRLKDPSARASDIAAAMRELREFHALQTGGATSRTESVNVELQRPMDWDEARRQREAMEVMDRLASLDDDALQAWLLQGESGEPPGLVQLRDFQRRLLAADDVG